MDMNQFRPDFHIAQQSRRDKLRIQNDSSSPHQGVYFNEQNDGNWRPGNICYDIPVFCSEMLGYPPNRVDPGPYLSSDPAATVSSDPQYFSTWKSIGSQSSSDWVTNHNSVFVGNSSMKIINSNTLGYHDTNSSSEISNANYQNALQELVTPSSHAGKVRFCGDNSKTQALSLSLSSSPRLQKDICAPSTIIHDSGSTWKKPELSIAGRVPAAQTLNHRNPGPLGPFTGYATILTSSKFLRPAQQLLEELCCMARPKDIEICEDNRSLDQLLRVSSDAIEPSFAFNASSCSADSHHLQKKAKLLFMQDEVCKRYKQYHQQMQMVVSSFESVAGLSAATPYISLALKMVSKHFRCLKNTITDQLKSIKNTMGDELSSPSSSSKGDAGVSMLKFLDQNFHKQKGAAAGILENQHIWRPQRGLPERAVSILRAWLFDHFLHPYPTDTDKHMLATQTGLTRNQVSNWFINARVRVWKPMVEEIHMLETKGGGVADQTESDGGGKTTLEAGCDHQATNDQSSSSHRLRMSAIPDKQVECSTIGPSGHEYEVGRSSANIWNQEKRSRIEYQMIPSSIDGSLMGLVPSGIEMGGLGSVSLTLGLRQSDGTAQRQPEQHHLRPHMGGQIIRDFVG